MKITFEGININQIDINELCEDMNKRFNTNFQIELSMLKIHGIIIFKEA